MNQTSLFIKQIFRYIAFTVIAQSLPLHANPLFVSTESDPDAFIQNCVNVINGDYCEAVTDLVIAGPEALLLQRFYNSKNYITGSQSGGWRLFPQQFLVIGKSINNKTSKINGDLFEWTLAFTGERSGGILPYSGWRDTKGKTRNPLTIDSLNTAIGLVNTHAKEITGQTNRMNHLLHCKDGFCELNLGDGTKRIYQKVPNLPDLLLGEELTPKMAAQLKDPEYYILNREELPSGNKRNSSDPLPSSGHLNEKCGRVNSSSSYKFVTEPAC